MRALLAIFFAILGALAGGVFAFVAIYPLLVLLEGGHDMNGGIAMGVGGVIAPLCAAIGAAAGLTIALRVTRPKRQLAAPLPDDPLDAADVILHEDDPKKRLPVVDGQALFSIAVVAIVIISGALWLTDDGSPPSFPVDGPRPELAFEIRVPQGAIARDPDFRIRAELESGYNMLSARHRISERSENGKLIVSGTFDLANKVEKRTLWLWMNTRQAWLFDLALGRVPQTTAGFGGWQPVSRIEDRQNGTVADPPADTKVAVRTRIAWPGEKR